MIHEQAHGEVCRLGPAESHIDSLEKELLTLKAALEKSEAREVVMREALRGCHLHIGAFDKYYQGSNLCKANEAALSSTSGSRLMERMRLLEKVVVCLKIYEEEKHRDITDINPLRINLYKAIRELDALQSKDTL